MYICIPLFLISCLFSQLQIVKVKDMHDALGDEIPITGYSQDMSAINTLVVMIPAIGPYLEVNSITSLFKDMKAITDKYSEENSSKIFKQMEDQYNKEMNLNGESVYLYNYNCTIGSLVNYFKNYSLLGSDSQVVKDAKADLTKNLKLIQIISLFKIFLFIVLFIMGLIGVFVFKGRYSSEK